MPRPNQDYDPGQAPAAPAPESPQGPPPIGMPWDYGTGPASGGGSVFQKPGDIFFPGGTRPPHTGPGSAPRSGNLYYEGDESEPAILPPNEIWDMQQKLVRLGLLAEDSFQRGVWDPATQSAYKWILGLANRNNVDSEMMIEQMLAAPEEFLFSGEEEEEMERPPLVTRLTDPEQLRNVFRRSVIELTGEGWSQGQIDQMITAYNDVERSRQQEYYDMSDPEGEGGEVFDVMSPEAFIQSRVEEQDPLAIPSHEMLQFAQEATNMIGSAGWGAGLPSSSLQGGQL